MARYEAPSPPFAPVATKAQWAERVRRWIVAGPAGPSAEATAVAETAEQPHS
jgi:hypothetical protein